MFAASSDDPENRLIVNPRYIQGNSLRSGCSGISGTKPSRRSATMRVDARR